MNKSQRLIMLVEASQGGWKAWVHRKTGKSYKLSSNEHEHMDVLYKIGYPEPDLNGEEYYDELDRQRSRAIKDGWMRLGLHWLPRTNSMQLTVETNKPLDSQAKSALGRFVAKEEGSGLHASVLVDDKSGWKEYSNILLIGSKSKVAAYR
jgi:hypothetical protein